MLNSEFKPFQLETESKSSLKQTLVQVWTQVRYYKTVTTNTWGCQTSRDKIEIFVNWSIQIKDRPMCLCNIYILLSN